MRTLFAASMLATVVACSSPVSTRSDEPASAPPTALVGGSKVPGSANPNTVVSPSVVSASVVSPSALPTNGAGSSVTVAPVPPSVLQALWSVVDVVDGDTLKVSGPRGQFTVRLIGMNSPEKGECFAAQATAAMNQLVAGHSVTLTNDVSNTDRYGRLLRFVETDDGVDVGAEMIRGGFAVSRRYPPDTARNRLYDDLQSGAQARAAGEWAPDACGQAVAAVSILITQHANAAGDDNKNLNDEWVRFTNQAASPANISRWIVADESSSHRYVFGDFVLSAGASVTLYTGCGQNSDIALYWCNTNSAVWNNSGDTVFLRDPKGNNVVVLKY